MPLDDETLAELARASADDFPVASAALEGLLAEPMPKDAGKDELWVSLVVGLAEEQMAQAFPDETLDWGSTAGGSAGSDRR